MFDLKHICLLTCEATSRGTVFACQSKDRIPKSVPVCHTCLTFGQTRDVAGANLHALATSLAVQGCLQK